MSVCKVSFCPLRCRRWWETCWGCAVRTAASSAWLSPSSHVSSPYWRLHWGNGWSSAENSLGLSVTCLSALLSSLLFIRQHGFSFVRLDGTMNQKRRTQAIQEFQSPAADSPTIMLLSLKAGGVGLNLTAASHVFLMDPVRTDSLNSLMYCKTAVRLKGRPSRLRSHLQATVCFRRGILLRRSSASTAATAWDRRGTSPSPRSQD